MWERVGTVVRGNRRVAHPLTVGSPSTETADWSIEHIIIKLAHYWIIAFGAPSLRVPHAERLHLAMNSLEAGRVLSVLDEALEGIRYQDCLMRCLRVPLPRHACSQKVSNYTPVCVG